MVGIPTFSQRKLATTDHYVAAAVQLIQANKIVPFFGVRAANSPPVGRGRTPRGLRQQELAGEH